LASSLSIKILKINQVIFSTSMRSITPNGSFHIKHVLSNQSIECVCVKATSSQWRYAFEFKEMQLEAVAMIQEGDIVCKRVFADDIDSVPGYSLDEPRRASQDESMLYRHEERLGKLTVLSRFGKDPWSKGGVKLSLDAAFRVMPGQPSIACNDYNIAEFECLLLLVMLRIRNGIRDAYERGRGNIE
jgi:hypothetical protein